MHESPGSLRGFFSWAGGAARLYLRPAPFGQAGPAAAELILRDDGRIGRAWATPAAITAWAAVTGRSAALSARLTALSEPPSVFAGLPLDRPRLMGVINVTPDSFSDGGHFLDAGRAVAHGLSLAEAGADILDVGGESTRPGAAPVSPDDEVRRVAPVIAQLAERGLLVSVDTRHAAVMRAALRAGARIINDITGLTGDSDSLALAADSGAAVILMHMQGEPRTMQVAPHYADVALDVFDWLEQRVEACRAAGLPASRIAVDPGIGFGKTVAHNVALLSQADLFRSLGPPVLFGSSRKSFIGRLSRGEPAHQRLGGSIAAVLAAADRGIPLLRVHDVAETVQALAVWRAIRAEG